ncbi:hypothetical protein ACOQFV_24445 [Nocardiopsis changdeensis]|uniref:DUF222 domain-containing protein n=1 Tax=Nocardiopsis changdeensis TaxID=2831969 RepID=A0A975KQH0_9ACTN|nr:MULTISPECIES: hypothetical protein [Nocardiopsis]QUX26459.1 hypothetical protein KGD84_32695 [Nocardiopsis changdeensis]QYX40731.1 hypothetical protein K1J57_32545 [Nocardiopsis sp. MT53]
MTITITPQDRRICAALRAAALDEAEDHLRYDPRVPAMSDEELKEALIHHAAAIIARDLCFLAALDPERARRSRQVIRALTAEARARDHRTAAPEV